MDGADTRKYSCMSLSDGAQRWILEKWYMNARYCPCFLVKLRDSGGAEGVASLIFTSNVSSPKLSRIFTCKLAGRAPIKAQAGFFAAE